MDVSTRLVFKLLYGKASASQSLLHLYAKGMVLYVCESSVVGKRYGDGTWRRINIRFESILVRLVNDFDLWNVERSLDVLVSYMSNKHANWKSFV